MIAFKNFNYKYLQSENLNIENLNLTITKGECVLLTGNSGSGKTSILRVLNGLSPEFFEGGYSGEMRIAHLKIGDSLKQFSKIVGSVFQNPKNQFFNLDSTDELAFSMENYGFSREQIKERITELANKFNATHLLNRNILELSGGEKQKLAFMASMMLDADIYILDEITSNLDLKAIKLISQIISSLKEQGKTIIIAEHRIYYLKDLVDKMYVLKNGKIIHAFDKTDLEKFNGKEYKTRQLDLRKVEIKEKDNIINHDTFLKIENLDYKVNENLVSITNESFNSGLVYSIIGENGCGKTTFANVLNGLKKSKSNIILSGEKLKGRSLVKNTFQVMQDVNYQLFTNSVEKEIKLGNENSAMFNKVIDSLNIRKLLHRHPNTLSGGEKQRVAIASAILSKKKILIFDEPTSGLDYINMLELCNLINICKKNDIIIFIITHDYEFLCNVTDEVLYFTNKGIEKRIKMNKDNKNEIYNLMN